MQTVLLPLDTSIPTLIITFLLSVFEMCNVSTEAYYDSFWLVTRTLLEGEPNSRDNLLNRILITRRWLTLSFTNAKFKARNVRPLPSHYKK